MGKRPANIRDFANFPKSGRHVESSGLSIRSSSAAAAPALAAAAPAGAPGAQLIYTARGIGVCVDGATHLIHTAQGDFRLKAAIAHPPGSA